MTSEKLLDGDWGDGFWSRTNLSEAMPGVLTPLGWTIWQPVFERSLRRSFHAIGVLSDRELQLPNDQRERMYGIFFGRPAAKVDFMGEMGDRLPGTSGAQIAEQFFGTLPDGFTSHNTWRRLPAIALRMPQAIAASPRYVRSVRTQTDLWWRALGRRVDSLDLTAGRREWEEARRRFDTAFTSHTTVTLACVQPAFGLVQRLATAAGHPDLAGSVVAGSGSHAESEMIEALWDVSRGSRSMADFVASYGFHGPREGEISARVWREEDRPLRSLVQQYRRTGEGASPAAVMRTRLEEARAARVTLLAALPRGRREVGGLALQVAERWTCAGSARRRSSRHWTGLGWSRAGSAPCSPGPEPSLTPRTCST